MIVAILVGCGDSSDRSSGVATQDESSSSSLAPMPKEFQPARDIKLPDFEVVMDEISDTPLKTQVELHIVVSGKITEDNLRTLLNRQYQLAMDRRGFKYHKAPTNVYIYTYDSEEKAKAGQGLWLAMLQMGPLEKGKPKLTVRPDQIVNLGKAP
ncbi:MAG: hypothetical protein ACE5HK_02580, partial [Candidatus Methylomirabilales bacterium]